MLILNNMYVGGYLTEGENIGHEVINLQRAVDGNFYIYLNSQGTIPAKIIEKCEKNSPIDVLMIRPMSGGVYKILGLAKNCKIDQNANSSNSKKDIFEIQNNIKYKIKDKEFLLGSIYTKNWYNGKPEPETVLYTFICKTIYIPIKDLYITNNSDLAQSNDIIYYFPKTGNETLRQYYYDFDLDEMQKSQIYKYKDNDYEYLNTNNKKQWEELDTLDLSDNNHKTISDDNFYRRIRKDNDEVILSNSIISFLNLLDKKNEFVEKISNIKSEFNNPLREEFNIDLLFSNGRNDNNGNVTEIVIIENKLDSGINGTKKNKDINSFEKYTKDVVKKYVDRYYESSDEKESIMELRTKKILDYFSNETNKTWSQLAKYYIFALNQLLDNKDYSGKNFDELNRRIHPFLLVPEYRKFEISLNKNKKIDKILGSEYAFLNYYNLITYKDIFEIFEKFSISNLNESNKIRYNDFMEVLNVLSNELNNSLEYKMVQRLYNII